MNECTSGAHDCGENADCNNLDGEFYCACAKGFKGGKPFSPIILFDF